MHEPGTYYKHSGSMPPMAIVCMLLAIMIVPIPLSFAYGYMTYYSPLIYINGIGTLIYGFAIGYSSGWLGKSFKIRNDMMAITVGIIGGLIALYFAWVTYVFAVLQRLGEGDVSYFEIMDPFGLWATIMKINEVGLWSLRGNTPVNGIMLWIFWAAEAVMIIGACIVGARKPINAVPFCEDCDCWTDHQEGAANLQAGEEHMLKKALESQAYEALTLLPQAKRSDRLRLAIDVFSCPRCQKNCFLSVKRIEVTTNDKGKDEEKSSDIVTKLCVPAEVIQTVRAI